MPRLSARWGKENLVIILKQNKPANLLIPRRSTAAFPENIFLEKNSDFLFVILEKHRIFAVSIRKKKPTDIRTLFLKYTITIKIISLK